MPKAPHLQTEIATYNSRLSDLLASAGKFALIKGEDVQLFDTYNDALKAGYERFQA